MTLQTAAMISLAGDDWHVGVYKNQDGSFSGVLFVNHPTPSGCARYLPALSDKRSWKTAELAQEEFEKLLPKKEAK
jgi:hypothetical protein